MFVLRLFGAFVMSAGICTLVAPLVMTLKVPGLSISEAYQNGGQLFGVISVMAILCGWTISHCVAVPVRSRTAE